MPNDELPVKVVSILEQLKTVKVTDFPTAAMARHAVELVSAYMRYQDALGISAKSGGER